MNCSEHLFLFLTFQKHPEECCEMEVAENHVDIAPDWNYGLVIRMLSRASDKGLKVRKRIIKVKEIRPFYSKYLYKCCKNPR